MSATDLPVSSPQRLGRGAQLVIAAATAWLLLACHRPARPADHPDVPGALRLGHRGDPLGRAPQRPRHRVAVVLARGRLRTVLRRRARAVRVRHPRRPEPGAVTRPGPHHHPRLSARGRGLASASSARRQRGRDSQIDTMLDATVAALAAMALGLAVPRQPDPDQAQHVRGSPGPRGVPDAVGLPRRRHRRASPSPRDHDGSAPTTSCWRAMGAVLVGDVVYMFLETHAISVPLTLVDLPVRARVPARDRDRAPPVDARAHRAPRGEHRCAHHRPAHRRRGRARDPRGHHRHPRRCTLRRPDRD